ncbi:MAG: cupin domain-containing protein [Gammaproteobacteria bacterium]
MHTGRQRITAPGCPRTRHAPRTIVPVLARVASLALILTAMGVYAAETSPGITPIPLDTAATETFQYPENMRVGAFDGSYREAVAFPSTSFPAGRVAFWAAQAGTLRSNGYPVDEFVYVIEGELDTIDDDGTTRSFGPGATFVIPKGC